MILVDTSAWIEFFRGREPVAAAVDAVLAEGRPAVCGPILTELQRGFRDARERSTVLNLFEGCASLEQPAALWEEAGELGFALRRRGVTPKTLDLLIAVYALAHSTELLSVDRDFVAMRKAGVPLRLTAF